MSSSLGMCAEHFWGHETVCVCVCVCVCVVRTVTNTCLALSVCTQSIAGKSRNVSLVDRAAPDTVGLTLWHTTLLGCTYQEAHFSSSGGGGSW